jgi:hypothetical protein
MLGRSHLPRHLTKSACPTPESPQSPCPSKLAESAIVLEGDVRQVEARAQHASSMARRYGRHQDAVASHTDAVLQCEHQRKGCFKQAPGQCEGVLSKASTREKLDRPMLLASLDEKAQGHQAHGVIDATGSLEVEGTAAEEADGERVKGVAVAKKGSVPSADLSPCVDFTGEHGPVLSGGSAPLYTFGANQRLRTSSRPPPG